MNTLLIIEDNQQNFYMMKYLLEKNGFQVIGSETGAHGLELAAVKMPYGILLDIQLPEMDGYEVLERLKGSQALSGIPVIAVTSYAMQGDRERIMAAGADGYLEKPIDPETFVDSIRYFLAEHFRAGE
jgi:two-component system, cell cycle response regulator DivK